MTDLEIVEILDKLITEYPNHVMKPDPELFKLAEELIKGVER